MYGVYDCTFVCVNLHVFPQDFDRRVVPEAGLDEVIVEDKIMKQLREIVQFEKARSVLFGQWGFARRNHQVGRKWSSDIQYIHIHMYLMQCTMCTCTCT